MKQEPRTLEVRLLDQPEQIEQAEITLLHRDGGRRLVAEHLAQREAELVLTGEVNGKNELERTAQLKALTCDERAALERCENEVRAKQIALRRQENELKVLLALARLRSGREER
jgi:hypothetical protein